MRCDGSDLSLGRQRARRSRGTFSEIITEMVLSAGAPLLALGHESGRLQIADRGRLSFKKHVDSSVFFALGVRAHSAAIFDENLIVISVHRT